MTAPPVFDVVPVRSVHPDPSNPRRDLGDLSDLATSIKTTGLLEPVVVRAHPDREGEWMIVAGHRRHAAHVTARLKTIQVAIRQDLDGERALAAMLVENLQRVDLSPLDEAAGYRQLVELGWKQRDIATAVTRSPGHISKRLRLLELPPPIADAVRNGELTVDTGYELAKTLAVKGVDVDGLVTPIIEQLEGDRDPWEEPLDLWVRDAAEREGRAAVYRTVRDGLAAGLVADGRVEATEADMRGKSRRLDGYGCLEVDWDEHQPEPCSRFWLRPGRDEPRVEWWCVDPTRHLPDGPSKVQLAADAADVLTRRAEAEAAQTARDVEAAAARTRRVDWYRSCVERSNKTNTEGGLPVSQFNQFHQATLLLTQTMNVSALDLVAELLDLDGWKSSLSWGDKLDRVQEAFNESPVRTNMAVVLAVTHGHVAESWRQVDASDFRNQFLTLLGWDGDQPTLETAAS